MVCAARAGARFRHLVASRAPSQCWLGGKHWESSCARGFFGDSEEASSEEGSSDSAFPRCRGPSRARHSPSSTVHPGGSGEGEVPSHGASFDDQPGRERLRAAALAVGHGNEGCLTRLMIRGVNKAIIAGEVGNTPVQRIRKSGEITIIFNVGTGGMFRNTAAHNARDQGSKSTFQDIQWHKIIVHDERLGRLAMQRLKQGAQVYVEGELETRVFNDPVTGAVKRDRLIAVHSSGQILIFGDRGAYPIDTNM